MRTLALVVVLLILAVATGVLACRQAGIHASLGAPIAAAVIMLLATIAATIPLMLVRGAPQPAVAQAALVGTVIHMLVGLALGGGVYLMKIGLAQSFLFWLLGLYWLTLGILVASFVRQLRAAPVDSVAAHTSGNQ
jgi:hypothetical protein